MKVVVLVSGGIDSVTALHHAVQSHRVVGALGFDYGSKHNPRELPLGVWHANRLSVPHRTIRLPFVNELFHSDLLRSGGAIPEGHYEEATMKQTVVPFRNGIMLAIAAGFAESIGAEGLVIAAHSGDHAIYPDCREEFMKAMGDAINLGTYARIAVLRPFIDWDKARIVRRGSELKIQYARTWSCYKGGERHCGTCGTCVERREAFLLAGIPDPTDYEHIAPLPSRPA
ncbi:MAG: 7-cyano-7-deazaguanine synthase QueC [Verrucomicrobiales bacterium]